MTTTTLLPPERSIPTQDGQTPERLQNDRRAAAIVDLLDRVTAASQPQAAYEILVHELQTYLNCQSVALGLAKPERIECKLTASTRPWTTEEVTAIESAMAECLAREVTSFWPSGDESPRHALLAHKFLATKTNRSCILSLPLRDRTGVMQGALVVWADEAFLEDHSARQFLDAAAQPMASAVSLARKAQPNWWGRLWNGLSRGIRSRKFTAALAGLLILLGLLLIPMPYRIACDCELEPVSRRFVAAPFDGILEKTVVEPGDFVSEGDLLAVMDGREIRWELAGLLAEQSQAIKERDGHMAKHDFGAAQVAKLDVERLKLREQLLTKRSQHLEIRSPIDGLVVVGDLKKSEGVPLSVGEHLFEIAPLKNMVVEICIPEADIAWAEVGQSVEIVLDAYPESTWTGKLARIHPRSELVDDEHVFIGEIELPNPEAVLRPGMRGRAKITGPNKPLGWNLFHKPWYELRYWLGW